MHAVEEPVQRVRARRDGADTDAGDVHELGGGEPAAGQDPETAVALRQQHAAEGAAAQGTLQDRQVGGRQAVREGSQRAGERRSAGGAGDGVAGEGPQRRRRRQRRRDRARPVAAARHDARAGAAGREYRVGAEGGHADRRRADAVEVHRHDPDGARERGTDVGPRPARGHDGGRAAPGGRPGVRGAAGGAGRGGRRAADQRREQPARHDGGTVRCDVRPRDGRPRLRGASRRRLVVAVGRRQGEHAEGRGQQDGLVPAGPARRQRPHRRRARRPGAPLLRRRQQRQIPADGMRTVQL